MLSAEMKRQLLRFLRDDLGKGDVTGAVLPARRCRARIVAKERCTIAGLEEARFLFGCRKVRAEAAAKDGAVVKKGRVVMRLQGLNKDILAAERTALNVLGRMSGVATNCAEARRIAGSSVTVALTRKTMPGFNSFDKKAAKIAGIWPHRLNLNSFVLLKDNHLPFFASPREAVAAARKKYGRKMRVEVEVESLPQALNAAAAKPDIIMLDNLTPKRAKAAVKKLRSLFKGKIELSGGITMQNLRQYAKAKPDIISMGALTYATRWRDFSLKMAK